MSASARPELIRPFSHKNPPNSARAPEYRSMYAARNQFTAIKRSSENITTDDIVNLKREKQNLLQERTLLKAKLARFADINRHPKDAGRNQQIANSLERQVRTLEQLTASKRAEIAQLKGIQPKRAHVIRAGALIMRELMRTGGYDVLTVSENSLLAGMVSTVGEFLDSGRTAIGWQPELGSGL